MEIELKKSTDFQKKPKIGFVPFLVSKDAKMPILSARNLPLRYSSIEKAIEDISFRFPEKHVVKFNILIPTEGGDVKGSLTFSKSK